MHEFPRVIWIRKKQNSNDDNKRMNDFNSEDGSASSAGIQVVGTVTASGDGDKDEDVEELRTIFDDENINKYTDDDGKPRWKCKWCNNSFAGWNATKALAHVVKSSKADIKPCSGRISRRSQLMYSRLYDRAKKRREISKDRVSAVSCNVVSNNKRAAIEYDEQNISKRNRKGHNTIVIDHSEDTTPSGLTSKTVSTSTTMVHESFKKKVAPSFTQTLIHTGPNPNAETKLTMAIADLIHSCGLSFSLAAEPKFRLVLQIAKSVSAGYSPPTRKDIAGKLLDLNYCNYMKQNMEKIEQDVDIFGLCFFGDGATIKKMPLINVLASGAHLPVFVLEIVDCTKHLEQGGKKDARYIASLFRPHIDELELSHPHCTDVIFFDGASNVQKAGRVVEAKLPRINVLHGAEHVVSLFYKDLFQITEIKFLSDVAKRAYRAFGNGSRHIPYAIFQRYAKRHNEGKNIGLIRAADTRMAGQAIVIQRFLRLRPAIISTITSAEFRAIKPPICPALVKLLQSENMWNDMNAVIRAIFPGILLLRLADAKRPGMDKLYFFVRQMDQTIARSKQILDDIGKKYGRQTGNNVYSKISNYFFDSSTRDSADYQNEFRNEEETGDDDEDEPDEGTDAEEERDNDSDDDSMEQRDEWKSKASGSLGDKFEAAWMKRRDKLVHDLSISGWMVCPYPDVMRDAYTNHDGDHRDAVERQIRKWFIHTVDHDEEKFGELLNTFWEEFQDFHMKQGKFLNKNHIWNSSDIRYGNSHFWHFKNSLRYTKVLGKFACRVCSKILGIGSAERSWGDVKHLKTNKRSHLSSEKTKKQATIYGSYCMEKASMYGQWETEKEGGPITHWTDEDFDIKFNMCFDEEAAQASKQKKQIRFFKAWEEEWEEKAVTTKDPVSVAMLLQKYGGLGFWDEDTEQILTSESSELDWRTRRGKNKSGYCIKCYPENYDKDAEDAEDEVVYWEFADDFRYSISEHYKKNPNLGVQVLELKQDDGDDEEEAGGQQTQSTTATEQESKYH